MREVTAVTVPHTGTHTLIYLFGFYGHLPLSWGHFEEQNLKPIQKIMTRDDHLFITTDRTEEQVAESFRRRHEPDSAESPNRHYYERCLEIRRTYWEIFPTKVVLPLFNGTEVACNNVVYEVFERMESRVPFPIMCYMKEWFKINPHDERDIYRGFTREEWRVFRRYMSEHMMKRKS